MVFRHVVVQTRLLHEPFLANVTYLPLVSCMDLLMSPQSIQPWKPLLAEPTFEPLNRIVSHQMLPKLDRIKELGVTQFALQIPLLKMHFSLMGYDSALLTVLVATDAARWNWDSVCFGPVEGDLYATELERAFRAALRFVCGHVSR
jgi:hypothetical protein